MLGVVLLPPDKHSQGHDELQGAKQTSYLHVD